LKRGILNSPVFEDPEKIRISGDKSRNWPGATAMKDWFPA
jgi:hypothetical protein